MIHDPQNPMLMTDGYKPSHWAMYPPGLQRLQSYFESRPGARWDTTVFFGLQYYLLRYLTGPVLTYQRLEEARNFFGPYFNNDKVFHYDAWKAIIDKHEGFVPGRIRALPEGTVVPVGCASMVLENTDWATAEVVNYLFETMLVKVWYPSTVATQSREIKKVIAGWVQSSGGPREALDWMVHDFGYRGVSSEESAALGGAGHLLSFFGSDTLAGDIMLRNYYEGHGLVSGSIPASEHSTVTSWGEAHEVDFLDNLLQRYPTGIVANVIDSFNPERYINVYARKFRDQILARDGKLVFRPDSGDPQVMVVQVLEWLGEIFGWEYNEKGYKVLNPKVGVIYGDGMRWDTVNGLYAAVCQNKWAAHNVAIGSGGGLLQQLDRDTQRFAFKACWAQVNDNPRDVYKKPSSDPTKNSKRGRLVVLPWFDPKKKVEVLRTYSEEEALAAGLDLKEDRLVTVWEDGRMVGPRQTLEGMRKLAAI